MSQAEQLPIQLPESCPWGVAVFAHPSGEVLSANRYMDRVYDCAETANFYESFTYTSGQSLPDYIDTLKPGERGSCRIHPTHSKHGITSVEVYFERSAEDGDRVWVYTLEHPYVNNELRFSSRSELKMLRVLLDNTLEYVFFRDKKGHFILANEAFRSAISMDGRTPGVDNKIEDFVATKSAAWMNALDVRVLETGRPVVNEVSLFVFLNGTKHWLQLTTVAVSNSEGEMVGYLSVARDISDLKRTESELRTAIAEAHQASRAKGDFLAAMSHEIRTPINGIIGASELCRDTPLDVEQRGYLDTVIQCGGTLLSLVNDVLDFSKIEAGQLNLESLNFCPRSLIESLAEEFTQTARAKSIELVVGYDETLPEYLLGDPTRVKQVFYNLIGNAIKFTDSGEVSIRSEVAELSESTVRVRFSVTDSGIGISKERQKAVFKSFTQADMSTTRKYGGSGLGLSICKELVELMGGAIHVESEPEEGSRFEFELPFELSDMAGADAVPFNAELAGLRVLIIDDNDTNCDLYQQMCKGWGYRSHVAKDGVSGLAILEDAVREGDPFKLILLDQQMPGLTGLDLASLVRSRPDLRETKILLLSSSLNKQESDRAEEIGISRALSKPVKRVTLQEVILETFGIGSDQPIEASQAPSSVAKQSQRPLDILLVEDNPINQDLAKRRLKKLGHTVTLAENGTLAVEQVCQKRFDCILMDIQMPDMDGFEATRRIRAYEDVEGLDRNYIIAITAHALKGDRERCLNSGMDNYLPKPFRAEELKRILDQAAAAQTTNEDKANETVESKGGEFSERLKEMDAEDREDVIAAAPIFLKSCPKDLLKLENAVAQKDCKQVYFLAHTMKGVAGIFRSEPCLQVADEVERAATAENLPLLQEKVPALIQSMQQLATEVEFAVM